MAKELKKICEDFYNPRKYDLESTRSNEPSLRHVKQNYQNQVINFKPLAELQTVPPYGSFYNTSGNQNLQSESLNQTLPNINFRSNVNSESPNQAHTNVNFSSNVNNDNPNNNNIELQKTPVQYNQAISNPQMGRQFYPSLFLPSHQYHGCNQPFF